MTRSIKVSFLIIFVLILFALFFAQKISAETCVTLYPPQEKIAASEYYAVSVNNESSFSYITKRESRVPNDPQTATFTAFSFEGGAVYVEIFVLYDCDIREVIIRPLDERIVPLVDGQVISFTMQEPAYLSVEINGDTTHKCFIFADELEYDVPDQNANDVWYFGPGVHDIGTTDIPEGKNTLYIAGGAYVKGKITSNFSKRGEFQILGRGIFSGEENQHSDLNHLIQVKYPSRFSIDGPILIDSNGFHLDILGTKASVDAPNVIRNVKEISWVSFTDGFHVDKYIEVANLFIYNYDDALDISQYSTGGTVRDCVVWNNDYGSALLLSWVGLTETGNVTVENIDVIHFNEQDATAPNTAVIMANHGERGKINNIYVNDLRVECFDNVVHRLFSIRLGKSAWSGKDSDFGSISNIHISNVYVDDSLTNNVLLGQSEEHTVDGVLFENIYIKGAPVTILYDLKVLRNEFVKNIRLTYSYVQNGSFEQGDKAWHFSEYADVVNLYLETHNKKTARNGHFVGMQIIKTAGMEKTWQQITGLPDGQYRMTAWVQTSGEFDAAYLYANTGTKEYICDAPQTDDYVFVLLDEIQITDGKCEIGFILEASSAAKMIFDQVVFERY